MANEEIKAQNMEKALRAAADLYLEIGPAKTTKVMIAKQSGLSRRTIERYFKSETECVLKTSGWLIRNAHEKMSAYSEEIFSQGKLSASEIFRVYLQEAKGLFCREPRLFICYLEIKTYLYRNSAESELDYERFIDALGVRKQLCRIFELGSRDKSLIIRGDWLSVADYFYEMLIYHLSGISIKYDENREQALSLLDKFIIDTEQMYCFDKKQIQDS